jgi:hypothetical protein
MEKVISNADFEKMLVSQLSGQVEKTQLSSLSKSIAMGDGLNGYIMDWRWRGTPAFWDLVKVNFQIPIKEFNADSFFNNDRLSEINVVRKGIPVPKFFEIEATIRNSHRQV